MTNIQRRIDNDCKPLTKMLKHYAWASCDFNAQSDFDA